MSKPKIKVCAILWREAWCYYTKKIPNLPPLQLTTGFIIENNEEFVNIAMNADYFQNKKKLRPADGFIIPKKAIVKSEIIYSLNGADEKK